MTEYLRPRTLAEALAARAAHPDWLPIAGGTDVLVSAPHRPAPKGLLDLWRLPELGGITEEGGGLRVGAGVTWLEVQRDARVRARASILVDAAREIGALQIQARGTVGGNLATSSPVGDSLPVLLALEAELELASTRGVRRLPYPQFCTGYRKTALAPDELITAIVLPPLAPGAHLRWRKVGTRRAQSISKVMGAAAIYVDAGVVRRATVAFGAVADRPVRLAAVEAAVAGLPCADASAAARAAVASSISPITDVRSQRDYRLLVAENLVARFFAGLDASA
ncbi:MAG: FAD binding domain-containing protein [Kofleriaceae bacterium]